MREASWTAAVVAALEARGVNPAVLKSRGVGETQAQVAENASDAERMADRRVIVISLDGPDFDNMKKNDVEAPAVKKSVKKKRK